MANVTTDSMQDRLGEVFRRCKPKLLPDVQDQFAQLLTPESLEIIAGVVVAWVVGHFFGVGWLVDLVFTVLGMFAIGVSIFSGLDELFEFARRTTTASSDADLEAASVHLAKAIAILGVQVVLAVLFKGRPKGGRAPVFDEPPRTPGIRYKPSVRTSPAIPAGGGETSVWGDITVSTSPASDENAIALLHEKVHSFLTPKFYILRRVRVQMMSGSYVNSSLWRYTEEALAETIGQVGVKGFAASFNGLTFPVENGYVYLVKAGGFAGLKGKGLVQEGAGLIATGSVQALWFQLWFRPAVPTPASGFTQRAPGQAGGAVPGLLPGLTH